MSLNINELPQIGNASVVSSWVDSMQFLLRPDEQLATCRFWTALPEGNYEVCRLQMTIGHARRMIDVMAKQVDHYPSREVETTKKKKRKKKTT